MKTTIEVADALFRKIKAAAAEEGITLKQLITDALQKRLRGAAPKSENNSPDWMQAYGGLRHLRRDLKRVEKSIESEFEDIEPEDRA